MWNQEMETRDAGVKRTQFIANKVQNKDIMQQTLSLLFEPTNVLCYVEHWGVSLQEFKSQTCYWCLLNFPRGIICR